MATSDWAIPQQAKLKYTQLFNLHDRSRSGFLSGLQCRDILMQSGLPRNILAEIWNLSDIDGDGQLTREEFILAMHLTNQVRSGNQLPAELSIDLVPPSYRKARSISATSVHSASSVSSIASGSVTNAAVRVKDDQSSQKSSEDGASILNTNSFEDKRRENFEKGRAELERRRLKMFESQISVLSEQLAASKKQVAEAKARIDSMRSDRDSKAGLITSLEAQLQTVGTRKAFLQQEEANLIAIAKDLNLVNSTQSAEIDLQACKVKEESIKQMKEKLSELKKTNEERQSELNTATQSLEANKQELKSLSEEASKVYKEYKQKLADAKIVRQQLIEENKSKPVDLDAAWGVAETFRNPINEEALQVRESQEVREVQEAGGMQEMSQDILLPKRYHAIYAFEARNPDELTINPGDIITGSEVVSEPGWLSGELNGKSGLFPEDFVELLPNYQSSELRDSNENSYHGSNEFRYLLNSTRPQLNAPVSEPAPAQKIEEKLVGTTSKISDTNDKLKYKVVYAFDARNLDELTIEPGDIIYGIDEKCEPGWLMGECNGKKGLFPEAYVEQVDVEPSTTAVGSASDSLRRKKSRGKKAEVATVIANYRALGQEQLSLEKGQLVLIRRKTDSGWWEGELQIKGKKKQFGWFPSSYVKSLQ